jgi:hypothetical protein
MSTLPATRHLGTALLALGLLGLSGCFTPRTTERMRMETLAAVQAGDHPTAVGTLNELFDSHYHGEPLKAGGKPAKDEVENDKQALLWHMERGLADHLAGDLPTSNRHLDRAGELVDLRRTKTLVTEAGTFLGNDTLRDYPGTAFEHTQVDYYRSLNRLLQAQGREGTYVPSQLAFTPQAARPSGKAPVPFALTANDGVSAADNHDRAINFARRMTINQLQETADAASGQRYDDDPFARFLAGALTYAPKPSDRADSNRQFADVMLKRAMGGYLKQAEVLGRGQQPFRYEVTRRPETVETLFIRHCRAYDPDGFASRLQEFGLSEQDPRLARSALPPGHGMVLVLNHVGFITHPEVLDIRAVAAQFRGTSEPTPREAARGVTSTRFHIGGILFWAKGPGSEAVNTWIPVPIPGELVRKLVAPGGAAFMGFAIPTHTRDRPIPPLAVVRARPAAGGSEVTRNLEVLSDLDAFARATLKDDQPRILAKTMIRAAAKQASVAVAAHEVEQRNRGADGAQQLLGMAVNLLGSTVATLSEVADTRGWTTLPDHIEGVLLDLPAGRYSLTLDTAYGPVECGGVSVEAERLVVVPIRTFPEPLPAPDK